VSRRLGAVACLIVISLLPGCGGGGGTQTIGRDDLRNCLGAHGAILGPQPSGATGFAPLFHLSPDLQGSIGGTSVAVFVEKNAGAARGVAADARGALGSVGIHPGPGGVVQGRNAVIVLEPAPSARARAAVAACLTG
jgi:hypothetical protein